MVAFVLQLHTPSLERNLCALSAVTIAYDSTSNSRTSYSTASLERWGDRRGGEDICGAYMLQHDNYLIVGVVLMGENCEWFSNRKEED